MHLGSNKDLRKKLWLRIARHVVEQQKDIKKAMDFLSTGDLLKIEDILPFFPDFVLIDDFKDQICKSLEDYNKFIFDLKTEMDEATNNANMIRMEIENLRNKYGYVRGNQKCAISNVPILNGPFYLFPCGHAILSSYLRDEVAPHLDEAQSEKLKEYEQKLVILQRRQTVGHDDPEGLVPQIEEAKNNIDKIIAAECPLCGRITIRSIDKPFVTEDDTRLSDWAV